MIHNIHTKNQWASDLFECPISNLAVLVLAIGFITEVAFCTAAVIAEDSALFACAVVAAAATLLPFTLEMISGELKRKED